MFRLLFHVIAHVYHAHFREIVLLQLHAHLNALFAHFVGFSYTFSLVDEKELEVSIRHILLFNTFEIRLLPDTWYLKKSCLYFNLGARGPHCGPQNHSS